MTEVNSGYKYQGHTERCHRRRHIVIGRTPLTEIVRDVEEDYNHVINHKTRDWYTIKKGHKKTAITVLNFLKKHSLSMIKI